MEKEIYELRIQRKKAIENHEFERAKELDQEIKNTRTKINETKKENYLNELIVSIENYTDHHLELVDELNNKLENEEFQIRQRFHNAFQEMKKSQKSKLIALEKEHISNMTKEKQRTIPEKELLLEKSRKEAMNGNYDKAIEHREKAKQIADETIAQRIVQVDNLFNQSRDKLMAQFKAAITELQTRFESELRSHEDKKEKAFDQKKTILENQIAIFIQKSLKDIAKDKLFDDRKSAYVYIQPIISSFLENRGIEFPDSSLIQSQATSARTSRTPSRLE